LARDRRNTRFFWIMFLLLAIAAYYVIVMTTTIDNCGPQTPQRWSWVPPPHWICGEGSLH
jgi:hypothetical protein